MNESESLQYGKPKKNDPRKTPAPKKDQKKGSKKKTIKFNASNRKIGMDRDPSGKEAGPHRIEILLD